MLISIMHLRIFGGLLLIKLVHSVFYPPSFVYQPDKDVVYQNREALVLRCVATANPSPSYTWTRNGKVFNTAINLGRYTTWPNEGTLIFALPGDDDDGIYQCIATNTYGTAYSNIVNVRRAEIQDFSTKDNYPTMQQDAGTSVKLKCQVPLSYPTPTVSWERLKNGQTVVLKDSNKYVTDIDGNLYITYLTVADDDQAQFSCTAFNSRMRIRKKDMPYTILVKPAQTNQAVWMMFRTVQPVIGIAGERVLIRCILGGYPAPNYRWGLKGSNEQIFARSNVKQDGGGTLLIIEPITEKDAGTYQCIGENDVTNKPVVIDFEVRVFRAPTLTKNLTDVNVPINGSTQFTCLAVGTPPPKIVWTANGEPIGKYLNGVNKIQKGNTIYLSQLQLSDRVVIQCNASNSIGYDYSNGYVNILQDMPEFLVGPQERIVKSENQQLTIHCSTFSAPKAIVSWTKDGFAVSGGRYLMQDNGDLLIQSLITADSGNYTCTARNQFGSISGSSLVFVRQRTQIMVGPINTWVYFGQEVKFVCTAQTDRLETKNLVINWYMGNNKINFNESARINVNLQDMSLIIMGAETTDTSMYTCNATNGIDYDVASAALVVQSVPFMPNKVSCDCITKSVQNIAIVKWIPGADNYAPIISFIVEYSTQFDRKSWYEVQRVSAPLQNAGTEVSVEVAMRPNIEYVFQVRAKNRVGVSDPTNPTTDKCYLPPQIPSTNPREVFIYGTKKDNIVIQWTPMPHVEHNGNKLSYVISVMCLNCLNIPNNSTNTSIVSDWDQNIIVYNRFQLGINSYDIESYKYFMVLIKAKNEMGDSSAPPTISYGFSGDGPPSLTPTISSYVTGRGYVNISWNVIQESDVPTGVNGFFRGYRIEWCLASYSDQDCDSHKRIQDVLLRSRSLPVLFGNFRRKRSVEENPYDFEFKDLQNRVYPSDPSIAAYHQVLSRRKRAVLARPDQWDYGSNLTTKLTMVPGNTQIKIWIRILNTLYAGPMSAPITITTFEDIPGPVSAFHLVKLGINHVQVQWDLPLQTNGNITGFQLGWREISGLELGYMTNYPIIYDPTLRTFQMSGLKSATHYRIMIWALTSQGKGVDSFIDVTSLPANIQPNAPRFTVTNIVNNTFNLTFTSSETGVKGSVFYAQYRRIGQYRWEESEPEYIRNWIFVENLANDTTYEVRVMATNGAGMQTPSISAYIHTFGQIDPTRPDGTNTIWFIIVILLIIATVLLLVLIVWYRDKRMEDITGAPRKPMFVVADKQNTEDRQLLYPESMLSSRPSEPPLVPEGYPAHEEEEPIEEDQLLSENEIGEDRNYGPIISDSSDLPPVSFEKPAKGKKSKKHRKKQMPEHDEDDDDAII